MCRVWSDLVWILTILMTLSNCEEISDVRDIPKRIYATRKTNKRQMEAFGPSTAFSYAHVVQNHGKITKVIHIPDKTDGNSGYSGYNEGTTKKPYFGPIYVTAKPVVVSKDPYYRSNLRDSKVQTNAVPYPLFQPYNVNAEKDEATVKVVYQPVPISDYIAYPVPVQSSYPYTVPSAESNSYQTQGYNSENTHYIATSNQYPTVYLTHPNNYNQYLEDIGNYLKPGTQHVGQYDEGKYED